MCFRINRKLAGLSLFPNGRFGRAEGMALSGGLKIQNEERSCNVL